MTENDPCKIQVYGSHSIIRGDYPVSVVRAVTSYPVQGYQYSKAFRKGVWDGRKHLLNKRTGAFPTGLVDDVKLACENAGIEVSIEDLRPVPMPSGSGFDLQGITLYEYQRAACETAVARKQGVIKVGTGGGKSEIAAAITQYLGLQTLFVVSSQELLYQAQKRFILRLGLSEAEVGVVGDGCWSPGSLVTIGMVQTLEARINTPQCQKLLKDTKVLFLDETHHAGSDTWYTVATLCEAYYRFGLSGTPMDRTDGANLRLLAAIGPLIVDVPTKLLVELGVVAKATIIWDKTTSPVLSKRIQYSTAYKQGIVENPELLTSVVEWVKVFHQAGLSCLVLCEHIPHGKMIDEALWTQAFIPHQFIYGDEDSNTRRDALESFAARRLPVLISSTILDEGVDVPVIDALILAGSRKSRIRTMQRLGRGLRGKKLIAVEFANFCHKYLLEHSLERLQDYKKEDCFDIVESGPDLALVTDIWNR